MSSQRRDLGATHATLTEWVKAKMPSAEHLRLSPLTRPGAGLSNETLLCKLSWREGGVDRSEDLVIRLEPADFLVFPEYDLPRQFQVMQCLGTTDVSVPVVRWLEEDESVLGCQFYVMQRIEGDIASEVPPYHAFGLCFDATPERRARMWWSGVETLARIHALDWKGLGLSFLGVPREATGPLDQQLDYYERFLHWARGEEPQPILEAALRWLKENRFAPKRVTLCWGDSRLPNLIFRNDEVVGVLDWEMAFLGDPEGDLAWWLFLDWQHSEGYGIPRLEGFPGTEETIRRYEALTGCKVENFLYHEVMAAFRFGVIMVKVAQNMRERGIPTPTPDFGSNNPCTQRLATLLNLPPPGQGKREMTRIEDATVRVQFHLTGPGGHDWYLVSVKGEGTRYEGSVQNPDVTLTASVADWEAIQKGELDRTQAYLGGKLVIEGDLTLLMQMEDMISRLSGSGQA